MRLIDADALKSKVEALVTHKISESDYEYGGNQALDYVADILIDEAPVVDAVEVVRCKDCKHHGMSDCPMWDGHITDDYMWCYFGERKEL